MCLLGLDMCYSLFEDESGWSWFIPLHDGTVSVGFVMDQTTSNEKKRASASMKEHYMDQFKFAPGLQKLIGEGELVTGRDKPDIQSASDYSYSADSYAGDHFRLIGDASGEGVYLNIRRRSDPCLFSFH
jgi:flavine halogenase